VEAEGGVVLVKITVKLAHAMQNQLQLIIGYLELGKTAKAIEAALELSKLVKGHTVETVENASAEKECGTKND
jgi:hypothetical protein